MAVGGDFVEDFVGRLGPDEGPGLVVPVGQPGPDVAFEGLDGAVYSALEFLLCEFGEPPLDQVQPRRAGRCEVQVEARVCQQPLLDRQCLVRRVIVEDQVDLKAGRDFPVELGQELLGGREVADPGPGPVPAGPADDARGSRAPQPRLHPRRRAGVTEMCTAITPTNELVHG